MNIGIFFGSSTGNTQTAAEKIKAEMGEFIPDEIHDVSRSTPEELLNYDVLFLGVSTWNIGEMQDDWADFLPKLDKIDLTGKKVALFAMGDAVGYPYNFLDAMGELWKKVQSRGAELVGVWPTEGYSFDESQAMFDENHFVGLGLDEDNESDLTDKRIHNWLMKVVVDLGFDVTAAQE
jgi:flavodoxin I